MVDFQRYEDNEIVENVLNSKAYYGELDNFPHTYELEIKEATAFRVQILEPDIEESENIHNLIVVKKKKRGGVDEVVRLNYKEADWEVFKDKIGGDKYRDGGSYESELEAGSYIVEVSTNRNKGKYVLVFGRLEGVSGQGYFKRLHSIYEVKKFFGKSSISVFQSPFYYVPSILLLLALVIFNYRRKNNG